QRRGRLGPRNRQDSGWGGRASLEPAGVAPDIQKHIGGQLLRRRPVAHQAEHKVEDFHPMAGKQGLHGGAIAARDRSEQGFVGGYWRAHGQASSWASKGRNNSAGGRLFAL